MSEFRQARWLEPLIFEIGNYEKSGNVFPSPSQEIGGSDDLRSFVPEHMIRKEELDLPMLTEVEVVRHFTRLSQMNFGVDNGFYPLGSCTMKYSPKVNDALASSDKVHWTHPYQPEETIQGTLEIMYNLAIG